MVWLLQLCIAHLLQLYLLWKPWFSKQVTTMIEEIPNYCPATHTQFHQASKSWHRHQIRGLGQNYLNFLLKRQKKGNRITMLAIDYYYKKWSTSCSYHKIGIVSTHRKYVLQEYRHHFDYDNHIAFISAHTKIGIPMKRHRVNGSEFADFFYARANFGLSLIVSKLSTRDASQNLVKAFW